MRPLAAILFAGLVSLQPLAASADHDVPVLPDVLPKIRTIVAPLSSQPAIIEDGTTLRVELDPEMVGDSVPEQVAASLHASFGAVRGPITLEPTSVEPGVASALWPGRTVHAINFAVPNLGGSSSRISTM
jgi:hypothetical protein